MFGSSFIAMLLFLVVPFLSYLFHLSLYQLMFTIYFVFFFCLASDEICVFLVLLSFSHNAGFTCAVNSNDCGLSK